MSNNYREQKEIDMNTTICDTCGREFDVSEDEPYQRVCDSCEQHADDYAEQRRDMTGEDDS